MSGVNKVILVGRLGKDPDIRRIDSGAAVATFSMATSETWKDRDTGERKEQVEWHNVVLWKALAEIAEKWLKKGDMLYVEGSLRNRSWDDTNGIKRYTTEIIGKNITLLTPKSTSTPPPEMSEKDKAEWEGEEDDLPF